MPGEDDVNLLKDTPVAIAMGNRAPLLSFDNRLFLLPRGQAPRITLTSVNFSAVKIKLVRVSERAMLPWTKENQLGSAVEAYAASQLAETGKTVWEGRADIPKFSMNTLQRTALPLPDAFQEPGLYALLVKPGDGQSEDAASAAQMILRTDLAPTVWRGTDGLTIQVRGYSDAKPRAGVKLDLLARDNDILASTTTDPDGVARFAAPLLAGSGPVAPASIHGMLDGDLVALDLNAAAFDLSDRGVEGMPHPGPLDAFVYTDRGIYRPGETVQVMALLRDAAGQPAEIPARIRVKRPNGEVFTESVPPRTGDAAENLPVTLSFGAAIGTWSVEVLADPDRPPIGRGSFRVDNFVPDRMAVELGADQGPIVRGQGLQPARHRAFPLRRAGREPHRQGGAASRDQPRSARRAGGLSDRARRRGIRAGEPRHLAARHRCGRQDHAAHPHREGAGHHASRARHGRCRHRRSLGPRRACAHHDPGAAGGQSDRGEARLRRLGGCEHGGRVRRGRDRSGRQAHPAARRSCASCANGRIGAS